MKSRIFAAALIFFAGTYSQTGGAEKYKPSSPAAATASLRIVVKNDSDADSWLRRIVVSVHDPNECRNPKVTGKVFAKLNPKRLSEVSSKPLPIDAGSELALTFYYIDAAYARNRICAVSAKMKPKAGAEYVAEFDVEKSIKTCAATLLPADDNASEPAEFSVMPVVCPTSEDPMVSGIGRVIIYQVHVQ